MFLEIIRKIISLKLFHLGDEAVSCILLYVTNSFICDVIAYVIAYVIHCTVDTCSIVLVLIRGTFCKSQRHQVASFTGEQAAAAPNPPLVHCIATSVTTDYSK